MIKYVDVVVVVGVGAGHDVEIAHELVVNESAASYLM
tara:strand:- start:205 stop:315 length:111 start_codon:yes stop_codon:yes gene_type:complete